jgi:N-acetylglucosamine-6-sulfatase
MALAVLLSTTASSPASTVAQETRGKPNFVFILADDMRQDDLKYMPKTRAVLADKGMRFMDAFISNAQCCPSRATIMRGQYSHNTGVWNNTPSRNGGWPGYKNHDCEKDNVATRLDDGGYRTGLFGKYLNGYKDTRYVPPGWDRWFAPFGYKYLGYDANVDGRIRHFGTAEKNYVTDVLSRKTRRFIEASAKRGRPFFAYVSPIAPHGPLDPALRDRHTYDGEKAPRSPSFNERDVSDKPPWIRSRTRLSADQIAQIDDRHEARAETLQALDDLVKGVVRKLRAVGELKNTYVVFTSDNGSHEGEHRIPEGKWRPYEEDIHMPLLVRGPGVRGGSTTHKLALNTDFLPTFTDLAGIGTPSYVDGRSLRPVLKGGTATWRRTAILLERRNPNNGGQSYYGIRTSGGEKYVEYKSGFRELYDLRTDPYELENTYDDAKAPPLDLLVRLDALKGCSGATCRQAENGAWPAGRPDSSDRGPAASTLPMLPPFTLVPGAGL